MLRLFDARAAKALLPGQPIIISDYPGLRLTAKKRRVKEKRRVRPYI
jgi:hypothetical protein